MITMIVANSIAAAVIVLGLVAVTRLGHRTAGQHHSRRVSGLPLGRSEHTRVEERRAA
jgi:hypothetical protein